MAGASRNCRWSKSQDSANTIITQYNLASVERELGRLESAESLGRDALERFTRVFGPKHPNTASALADHGETLVRLGRHDEAERSFTEAIAIAKAALGEKNPGFCRAASGLGRLLLDTGRAVEAEPVLREVVDVNTRARGPQDRRTANARVELGRCWGLLRRFAEAEPLLIEGHQVLLEARPADGPNLRTAERYLAEFYAAWNAAEPDETRAARATEWRLKVESRR